MTPLVNRIGSMSSFGRLKRVRADGCLRGLLKTNSFASPFANSSDRIKVSGSQSRLLFSQGSPARACFSG